MDAETGKTIPYAGAGFQIYDSSGNLITMEFTYPTPTTVEDVYKRQTVPRPTIRQSVCGSSLNKAS